MEAGRGALKEISGDVLYTKDGNQNKEDAISEESGSKSDTHHLVILGDGKTVKPTRWAYNRYIIDSFQHYHN